jgi:hypothetical protein
LRGLSNPKASAVLQAQVNRRFPETKGLRGLDKGLSDIIAFAFKVAFDLKKECTRLYE